MKHQHDKQEEPISWQIVDQDLRKALEMYNEIKEPEHGIPIFMDFIIRITTCRAYANLMGHKVLTAERLLDTSNKLINFLEKN